MAVWKPCRPSVVGKDVPVLFLDRDGVVIVDRNYLSDPDRVELLPGAAEAMKLAAAAGYLLIGVSNQSGLGRGLFTAEDLARVMARVDALLAREGTGFDGFYYCPHAPQEACQCRKPASGLLDEIVQCCHWDPGKSWMVGDKASDVAFGRNNGLGAVLVGTGYGAAQRVEVERVWKDDPRVILAANLPDALAAIQAVQLEEPDP
jgi:D-glycero-D-manno-heptose 1,7-bisphosphate phosphatase